jgi:hypothetical protein
VHVSAAQTAALAYIYAQVCMQVWRTGGYADVENRARVRLGVSRGAGLKGGRGRI